MRTFLAVPISATDELRSMLQQLAELRPRLKTISEDQLHVTSVFLGETDESLLPELKEIVNRVSGSLNSERVALRGLGAFPQDTRPTVVWAGFASSTPLIRLADILNTECELLGFPRETRPYYPHLTLARVKAQPPDELAELIRKHTATDFGTAMISNLTLFRSDLGPAGPTYTPLIGANFR